MVYRRRVRPGRESKLEASFGPEAGLGAQPTQPRHPHWEQIWFCRLFPVIMMFPAYSRHLIAVILDLPERTFDFHRMTAGDDVTPGTADVGDISHTTATRPTLETRNPLLLSAIAFSVHVYKITR